MSVTILELTKPIRRCMPTACAALAAAAFCLFNAAHAQVETNRNYDANFTENTIVADGVISPGEWDGAAGGGGDWGVLRETINDMDTANNEFKVLWDDTNLYMLITSPRTDWLSNLGGNPGIVFGEENLNIYFDPNNTDPPEENRVPDSEVDGYQLAFNQYEGTTISTDADRQGVGFFTEAHVDTPFGNQANWGGEGIDSVAGEALQDIVVGQTNGAGGSVAEIVWPWANFNADAEIPVDTSDPDGEQKPTGLNHPEAPANGDVWFMQVSQITGPPDNDNYLPVWSWTDQSGFASQSNGGDYGHGTLTFLGGNAGTNGDIDNDGDVDGADLVLIQRGFDDTTSASDFADWQANFGSGVAAAASAVPEPTGALLLLSGVAFAWSRKRR